MQMGEGRQGRLLPTLHCSTCPFNYGCAEGSTEYGCANEYVPPELGGRDILHPLRPDLTQRIWEVRGLDIRILTSTAQEPLPPLPAYIPRVEPRSRFLSTSFDTLAVPLERIRPSGPVTPASEMKKRLNVGAQTTLVVTSFQLDDILETAWRHRNRLVRSLATAGYDLVAVPNFSVWEGDTRLEHRYNIGRSLRMFEMFVEAGVPTIPHVHWLLDRDIKDWIAALRKWSGRRAFSLDLATLRTDADWSWGMRGLRRLADAIGQDWEVLVNGVALRRRIEEVSEICGHIHLTNNRPFQLAMARHIAIDEPMETGRTRRASEGTMEIFDREARKMLKAVPSPGISCALRR